MDTSNLLNTDWRSLKPFFDASPTSLVITDAKAEDQPIIFANAAFEKLTGYSLAEVHGKNCRLLQHNDRNQPDREAIALSIRTYQPFEGLLRNYRKSGEMFWNKLHLFPFMKSGEVLYFVGIQHDVTAEVSLLAELRNTGRERAQLIQMLSSERDRMAQLSHDLVNAQEAERRALARELHDEFGQRLCALKMLLDRSKLLIQGQQINDLWFQAEKETADLIVMVRNLSAMLRPPQIEHLGLEATIYDLLSRQFANGPSWIFEYEGLPERLSPELEISIFRIVQEGITNIVRHAQANHVVVDVTYDTERKEVKLLISDDGTGFDAIRRKRLHKHSTHMGLMGMSERVNLLGGKLLIDSASGFGTRIIATLPYKASDS